MIVESHILKMKILPTVVFALAAAQDSEKKVPPRHPLQRLNRLVDFTEEILTNWFGFLPSQKAWIDKFATQAARMEKNFKRGNQRCGFYDENQLPHGGPSDERQGSEADEIDVDRYHRENPSRGIKELTTGFSKWAARYLADCSGQKNYNYVGNKMAKWNEALQNHLKSHYPNNSFNSK